MLLTALLLSSYYLFGYTLKKVNNSDANVNVIEDVDVNVDDANVNEVNNLKFGGANNKPYHISYKTELPLYLTGTYYFVKYAQETHAIEFKTPSIRNHELLKDNPLLCSQLLNKRGKDITKANWIKRKKIIRNELILWISKIITPNILDDILPFMWNKYFPVYASCFFNSGPYWSTSKSHNENLLRSSGIHLDTNNPINPVLFLGVSDDGYPFGIPIRNDLNLEKQIKRMIKDSIPNILILFENKPISKKGIEGYFNKVQIDLIPIDTDFYTNTEKDSIETRLVYNLNFYIKLVQIFQELETAVEHATFKINSGLTTLCKDKLLEKGVWRDIIIKHQDKQPREIAIEIAKRRENPKARLEQITEGYFAANMEHDSDKERQQERWKEIKDRYDKFIESPDISDKYIKIFQDYLEFIEWILEDLFNVECPKQRTNIENSVRRLLRKTKSHLDSYDRLTVGSISDVSHLIPKTYPNYQNYIIQITFPPNVSIQDFQMVVMSDEEKEKINFFGKKVSTKNYINLESNNYIKTTKYTRQLRGDGEPECRKEIFIIDLKKSSGSSSKMPSSSASENIDNEFIDEFPNLDLDFEFD